MDAKTEKELIEKLQLIAEQLSKVSYWLEHIAKK